MSETPITIVDYKMGNIRSIENALHYFGAHHEVSGSPEVVRKSGKLILPGVGSFRMAMANIKSMGLLDALNEAVMERKIPVFGICLGMQIFADAGFEDGYSEGLGWIRGKVVPFDFKGSSIRIPHVGFNTAMINHGAIFIGLASAADFYFVHSYHFLCEDGDDVSAWCDYHGRFVASVQKGNVYGTQFHPEKSQANGLAVIKNFIDI